MGIKICAKIILEGTNLTMKTDIAYSLNEQPRIVGQRIYGYHSPLISAEWCTFTNFPWGSGLINLNPEEEKLTLETYRTWIRLLELQRYYSWIIDWFHVLTRVFRFSHAGKDDDFRWIEERLLLLGFRIVLLKRSDDALSTARAERLKVSGNPSRYDDLEVSRRSRS